MKRAIINQAQKITSFLLMLITCLLPATQEIMVHATAAQTKTFASALRADTSPKALALRATASGHAALERGANSTFGGLPLSFAVNQGQAHQDVQYITHGSEYTLFLTATEARFAFASAEGKGRQLQMRLIGGNTQSASAGVNQLYGTINYFRGNDPQRWQSGIATYQKVRYQAVYPGIDIIYYGQGRQLEYDFHLAPGADPNQIKLHFEGASNLKVDDSGDLIIEMVDGELRQHRPIIYQQLNNRRQEVQGRFVLDRSGNNVGFKIDSYDTSQPLVIDPVLSYSSFLGTPALDQLNSIAVDLSGNILVTGYSYALGDRDILIAKLDPTGTSLIYSGIIGAAGTDEGNAITADREGNAYVTGQMSFAGYFPDIFNDHRLFIMKIDPAGNIVYNASQTGSYDDKGNAITVDSAGYAYVAGTTQAWSGTGLFNWRGFQTEYGGFGDGFVLVINPEGTNVVYSSYIGGGLFDQATGIALDAAGYVYVTGGAGGGIITTPEAFQPTYGGDTSDGYVLKIDPSQDGAASLVYSTYLGGDDFDQANAIAVDPAGHAYVTGSTKSFLSAAFPTTPGAFQPQLAVSNCSSQPYYFYMCDDAFVTKLDPTGASLVYSTFLGGTGSNYGNAIAVDEGGNVIVAGLTGGFFPVTENAFQPTYGGGYSDGFVTKFTPDASSLVYSSFLGGGDYDTVLGITTNGWGNLYAAGKTSSANFPVLNPLQEIFGEGSGDGFISIITDPVEGVADNTSNKSRRSVLDGMIQNRKTDSFNLAIGNEKPNIKLNHGTKLLIGRCMAEQSLTCGEPK